MSYLKDREVWLEKTPTGNPPAGYFWKFIQDGVVVVRDSDGVDRKMAHENQLPIPISYLIVAGGGGGGNFGGGGAGGYRTSYGNEDSGRLSNPEPDFLVGLGKEYRIQVGAGGGYLLDGTASYIGNLIAKGGGSAGRNGGSGGGGQTATGIIKGKGEAVQGFDGGQGTGNASIYTNGGGGGGAGEVGEDGDADDRNGGDGGDGIQSNITGTLTYRAGGGGGGAGTVLNSPPQPKGGLGGGGDGANNTNPTPTAGTANTGGGGGARNGDGKAGGSGVVILRYSDTYEITLGAGLTGSTSTVGSDKVTTITAGADTVEFNKVA